jgi:hypothetical protein
VEGAHDLAMKRQCSPLFHSFSDNCGEPSPIGGYNM